MKWNNDNFILYSLDLCYVCVCVASHTCTYNHLNGQPSTNGSCHVSWPGVGRSDFGEVSTVLVIFVFFLCMKASHNLQWPFFIHPAGFSELFGGCMRCVSVLAPIDWQFSYLSVYDGDMQCRCNINQREILMIAWEKGPEIAHKPNQQNVQNIKLNVYYVRIYLYIVHRE